MIKLSKIQRHYEKQAITASPCQSWLSNKFCKKCPGCIRYIAIRAVTHHCNKIKDQERRMMLADFEGNGPAYKMRPITTFKQKLPLGFSGILLGFDSKSYAYIRHLDNELLLKQEYDDLQEELDEFYCSQQCLRQFFAHEICTGELYAFELKPKEFMRAQIICVSAIAILVVNVDTGKIYEVAEVVQLYQTTELFFKLPFQVIRCKLFNLEHFLGTDVLGTVWKKMSMKPEQFIMTVIKVSLIPSVVILAEEEKMTLNTAILNWMEKYVPCQEPQKETSFTNLIYLDISKSESRSSYPGAAIEFFPNNNF